MFNIGQSTQTERERIISLLVFGVHSPKICLTPLGINYHTLEVAYALPSWPTASIRLMPRGQKRSTDQTAIEMLGNWRQGSVGWYLTRNN